MNKSEAKGYYNGYQAAMADIDRCLAEGGEEAVREWVTNNKRA